LTPMEAEFAKLFTNAYRYIQFAITNEFFSVANSAGVNYHNILGAITKNYPRAKGIPTPGFTAGPCLFKDTMQLVAYANNQFNLGTAGMLVNEGLVLYVIDRLTKSYDLSKMTVGILGMAFKADSDDIRSSLSYKMKKVLVTHADEVIATDPLVTVDDTLLPLDEVIDRSDLLILCTPHSAYKDLDTKGKPVADVWNYVNGALI
ncbi:MAG: nucleotide sugar dehydrogenase, partial [Alphaproteobacteria bacterium]|nr:nucleotide sugar dehydrogenase [Alphaproteobacteria bacterium]